MANTTLNPADKMSTITLSNGNLTATGVAGAQGMARAIDKQSTGKFYFEYTFTLTTSNITSAGGTDIFTTMTSNGPTSGGSRGIALIHSGGVYIDAGAQTGANFPNAFPNPIPNGSIVCFAIDLDARMWWVRLGAAGLWNNTANYDPAARVGGLKLTLGKGQPFYPMVAIWANGDVITCNFGDSAFAGTVPTGFTAGFPAGATNATNMIATQVAIEEWASATTALVLTQAMIEEWGSVTLVTPGGAAQARAVVMA